MALKLYFEEACSNEVTDINPDSVRGFVNSMQDYSNERALWIKSDNPTLTYENIAITAEGDTTSTDLQYALDSSGIPGTYAQSISLVNSTMITAVKIWRKVFCPAVINPIKKTDIKHKISWAEYLI